MNTQTESNHGGYIIIGALVIMLALPMVIGHFTLQKNTHVPQFVKTADAR